MRISVRALLLAGATLTAPSAAYSGPSMNDAAQAINSHLKPWCDYMNRGGNPWGSDDVQFIKRIEGCLVEVKVRIGTYAFPLKGVRYSVEKHKAADTIMVSCNEFGCARQSFGSVGSVIKDKFPLYTLGDDTEFVIRGLKYMAANCGR